MTPKAARTVSYRKQADADLDAIRRWVWGYSDGLAVPDLDRVQGAVVGAPSQPVTVPVQSPAYTYDGNGCDLRLRWY